MSEEKDKTELIKAENLYESLRFAEYDITSGIGEIIDNSIEAKSSKIYIDIDTENIILNQGKKKSVEVISAITITDNGLGMSDDILEKSLVLGESCRPKINGNRGIGRFGVGLTLGGISLARRIEVYSKNEVKNKFKFTYIDLDEIHGGKLLHVPKPIERNPETKSVDYLDNSTGTIIKLKNCDRLKFDTAKGATITASERIAGLSTFIGRTYRKFIGAGLEIFLNGDKVFLHDPLYLDGPTRFDTKENIDLKAEFKGEETIDLEIPNSGGKKAEVKIRMSLLPREWRKEQRDGGKDFALKRKINENEGISILRADREVLYGKIEYIIGLKGTTRYTPPDRFWGCEISFPPELDDYFHVRYIKRGAEPIPSLRDKIKRIIAPVVDSMRKEISTYWSRNNAEEIKNSGVFSNAENTMNKIDNKLPRSIKGVTLTEEEAEEKIRETVEQIAMPTDADILEFKKSKVEEIKEKPYVIELVNYPANIFFETEHVLGRVIIKLNINHPFYNNVIMPLCEINSDDICEVDSNIIQKSKFKDSIMLLLLSYSKAEAMFPGDDDLFKNFAFQWGTILSTATKEVFK